MKLFTIGFTKKTAEEFFELLIKNGVEKLVDIRLNNKSQLAGFAKGNDLIYLLKKLGGIEYEYMPEFAPSKELLKAYQREEVSWEEYEKEYISILDGRQVLKNVDCSLFDNACFLCSESTAEKCHRRLLVGYLKHNHNGIEINHL